jgi:hypothetical protein
MATAASELAVGTRRTSRLLGIEGHRLDPQLIYEALDAPEVFGCQPPDEYGRDLDEGGGGNLGLGRIHQGIDQPVALRLIERNRNDRRSIDDHTGNP